MSGRKPQYLSLSPESNNAFVSPDVANHLRLNYNFVCALTTMSHGHTHGPGEEHSHSHSHAPQQGQPQAQALPPPDPALQALIDQDYIPSALTLADDRNRALCAAHKLEKCTPCDVDFVGLNRLSALLVANPNLLCPPPANVVTQKITQIVTATKDEGNVRRSHPHAP